MSNTLKVQQQFLSSIEQLLPNNMSLADELADLLQVSKDSAYRRIREETKLSIEEIAVLCGHFKISFDTFLTNNAGAVTFGYSTMQSSQEGFLNYLKAILVTLEKITQAKNKEIFYAADDIPLFLLFIEPEIAAFKIFYWMKSVMCVEELKDEKYCPELVNPEIMETGKRLFDLYTKIPSVEIWSDTTCSSLLQQIEYYWEIGMFADKKDALMLCGKATKIFEHFSKQAECKSKFTDEKKLFENSNFYSLYYSEVKLGNNCILSKVGENRAVFINFNTFNSINTGNSKFCVDIEKWFDNIMSKSILISGVSEKHRYKFFQKVFRQIELLKSKIENE